MLPHEGSEGIPPSAPLRLLLSRAPASPDAARLEVKGSESGTVPMRPGYDARSRSIVFEPARPYRPGELVTARYAGGLKDTLGREFAEGEAWSFRVSAARSTEGTTVVVEAEASVLGPQPVRLSVRSSEPLAADPELIVVPPGGGSIAVELTRRSETSWVGEVRVTAPGLEGIADLRVTARDASGAVGNVRVPSLRIDTRAPTAPEAPLLSAGPRGRVDAAFGAAPSGMGVKRVLLFRTGASGGDPAAAGSLEGAGPGSISDRGAGAGRFRYTLAYEDEAGNRSPLSAPAEIEVSGPGLLQPVTGVQAVVRDGGIDITWEALALAGVDGYSVYRRPSAEPFDPLLVRTTLDCEAGTHHAPGSAAGRNVVVLRGGS